MCAKISKKGIQAASSSSSSTNRTPQSSGHRTMSSKQREKNNRSRQQTSSESTSGNNGTIKDDFLGRASTSRSSGEQSSIPDDSIGRPISDASSDDGSDTPPEPTKKTPNRRQPRKQVQPKKRKDRITKELLKMQSTTNLLIPRLPFQRLVREVLQKFKNDFRTQRTALECLHEAAESYLVGLFEDSFLLTLHRQRQTLSEKDIRLIQMLRGPLDAGR